MSFRAWVVIALLAAALAGAVWLAKSVPLYGLMYYDGEEWNAVAQGWEVLYGSWFFIVPGTVLSLVILFLLSGWVYAEAEKADHVGALALQKNEFERLAQSLQEKLEAADRRAENAEREALSRYEGSKAEADRRTEQALEEIGTGHSLQMAASERIKTASEEIKYASQEARRAEKKNINAMGAAERFKRRERLYSS